MSEMFPERITDGELADWVQLSSLNSEPSLQDPSTLYDAARQALAAAEDRGDPRVIDEANERLGAMLEAHPELRNQQ